MLYEITKKIIGAAIEVHRVIDPGLLESAYEDCLCHELLQCGLHFERQKPLALIYKDLTIEQAYRLDIVVASSVVIELKCVDRIMPIHIAQLLTYLRLSGSRVGLILNFHSPVMKNGIKRLAL
jgi:GxxExxY protein